MRAAYNEHATIIFMYIQVMKMKISIKQTGFICLSLAYLNTSASPENIPLYVIGAATTLIMGKLAYNYYQIHYTTPPVTPQITPQEFFENCQLMFKKMEQKIQQYHNCYHNDAHMSDWDLKEMIMGDHKNPYPFLTYYTSLHDALSILQQHHIILKKQLTEIPTYTQQVPYEKLRRELETEGNNLYHHISTTIAFMTSLKIRIKLFKEYHEDYYYWEQKEQKIGIV